MKPSPQASGSLRQGYIPSPYDIICGKVYCVDTSRGNELLHETVQTYLERYCTASTKAKRSSVITDIIETIKVQSRSLDPIPGREAKFIRFVKAEQVWYDMGEKATRRKISQALREIISMQTSPVSKKGSGTYSKNVIEPIYNDARQASTERMLYSDLPEVQPILDDHFAFPISEIISVDEDSDLAPLLQARFDLRFVDTCAKPDAKVNLDTTSTTTDTSCIPTLMALSSLLPGTLQVLPSSEEWIDVQLDRPLSEVDSELAILFDDAYSD